MVNAFFCHDGVATGFANLYGIDDSGCLRGPGLTLGFRGDRIVLKSWVSVGSFIVNASKQNRSVSIGGAGRVKSVGPVRIGALGGVVSIMFVAALLWVVEHCSLSFQQLYILRLTR